MYRTKGCAGQNQGMDRTKTKEWTGQRPRNGQDKNQGMYRTNTKECTGQKPRNVQDKTKECTGQNLACTDFGENG